MTDGKELRKEDAVGGHESRTDYILATGEAAVSRLELLDEIFGPHSRELLEKAGLANGMKAADIGCGNGLVSLWLASKVGPGGRLLVLT